MNMKKRGLPLLIVALFLGGFFIVPSAGITPVARLQDSTLQSTGVLIDEMLTSDLPYDRVFKVALYHETNTTTPDHLSGGMNSNYSVIYPLLVGAGFIVNNLTVQEIQNNELTTTNYDVLVLADNVPRENITNHVKDFWLAGGGVLGLDSAISYLGYAGILFRESEGVDDGQGTYWNYNYNANGTIVTRHPVTQSYENETELAFANSDWAQIDLPAFGATSVSSRTTVLAVDPGNADWGVAVAVDAFDKGGRVVQIGIPVQVWPSDWNDMIIDAIDWLAPRPKARIAFDFSHQPRLSVDDWDVFSTLTDPTHKFEDLRDTYVSNRYTFDKYAPSASGNFTESRLADYDIMILVWPDLNYTEAERTALMTWLDAGGGLIVLGDRNGMVPGGGHLYLNYLLDDLDMYLGENNTLDDQNAAPATPIHPTVGNAQSLAISFRNWLYFDGPAAQSVWEYDDNVAVAAQEYGAGRVVMFCDMNILDNSKLNTQHNKGYAQNIANWLSADDASILVYSDDPYDGGAYRSSVAQVLNQMEVPFYMTVSDVGFNASVNGTWFAQETWDLVILDHNNYFYSSIYDGLYDYLMNDGRAIVNTFRMNSLPNHPIWRYMGVNYSASWPANEPAHIWDIGNEIFNTPIDYTASTMNVSNAFYGDDGDMVTVFDNATALAGYSATEEPGNASIAIRNDGSTLLNSFLLNNLRGDIDDSAYLDTFELWFNQIALMLRLPSIDHPADIEYESGSTGHSITWTPSHSSPSTYEIFLDGGQEVSTTWDGSGITFDIDGLALGIHTVEVFVYGDSAQPIGDTVYVTVVDTTDPLLSSPADITMVVNTSGNAITWVASDPNPSHYVILMNSTEYDSGVWDGSSVVLDLDDLDVGIYFFTIRV
ncbi:MAG: DUF4350 domain-containing protein, partial [Candidatus Thorarchaeota archaeon]